MRMWFALLALIMAFEFISGCSRNSGKIEQVLIMRARAQAKYLRNPRTKTELDTIAGGNSDALLIAPAKYLSALQNIDISHCPRDFRLAWTNYVASWRNDGDEPKKFVDITSLAAEDAKSKTWNELKEHFHGASLVGNDF